MSPSAASIAWASEKVADAQTDATPKLGAEPAGDAGGCDSCIPIEVGGKLFGPQGVTIAAGHLSSRVAR
jgi:hypothetical protein